MILLSLRSTFIGWRHNASLQHTSLPAHVPHVPSTILHIHLFVRVLTGVADTLGSLVQRVEREAGEVAEAVVPSLDAALLYRVFKFPPLALSGVGTAEHRIDAEDLAEQRGQSSRRYRRRDRYCTAVAETEVKPSAPGS